jgi:hypothetical protein
MKNVLKNHAEVCHYWANNIQDSGRCNNMSFETNKQMSYLYSYGSVIGVYNIERRTFFLYTGSYSNSTSKHQNHMNRAIDFYSSTIFHSDKFFYPHYDFDKYLKQCIESYKENLLENYKKHLTARKNDYFSFAEVVQYAEKLGNISTELKDTFLDWANGQFDLSLLNNIDDARKVFRAKQAEKTREKNKANLAEFLNHERNYVNDTEQAYLRRSLDLKNIETSKGITLPFEVAKRYFKHWERNQLFEGQKILNYTINVVSDNQIKIGCHTITKTKQLIELFNN